jgi:hypothetical protein
MGVFYSSVENEVVIYIAIRNLELNQVVYITTHQVPLSIMLPLASLYNEGSAAAIPSDCIYA